MWGILSVESTCRSVTLVWPAFREPFCYSCTKRPIVTIVQLSSQKVVLDSGGLSGGYGKLFLGVVSLRLVHNTLHCYSQQREPVPGSLEEGCWGPNWISDWMRNQLLGDSLERVEPPFLCGAAAGVPFTSRRSSRVIEIQRRVQSGQVEGSSSCLTARVCSGVTL